MGIRDDLKRQYKQAQSGGYAEAWKKRNKRTLADEGAYFVPNKPTPGTQVGVGGRRTIGGGSYYHGNVNQSALNAYQTNPYARRWMDAMGMTPTVNGVSLNQAGSMNAGIDLSRSQGGPSLAQRSHSKMAGYPQWAGRAEHMARQNHMQQGGGNTYWGNAHNTPPSGVGAYAPPAGSPGVPGSAAVGVPGSAPYGLSGWQAGHLGGQIAGALGQEIQNPSGLPVGQLQAQASDAIAAQTQRRFQQIREDFGRRGQSGTAGEAQALRQAEEDAQGARRSDTRDIAVQNAQAQLARRLQSLGIGANFLRGERGDARQLLSMILGGGM